MGAQGSLVVHHSCPVNQKPSRLFLSPFSWESVRALRSLLITAAELYHAVFTDLGTAVL